MQVITTRHGPGKLATRTFVASESGFNVTSVIVMGERECILVDCQWTRANAHRVIAEICETGLELKAVYVTHAHPDHYWGLGEIHRAFPDAKCYALPPVCAVYHHQYQPKLDEWTDIIGPKNLCRLQCEVLEPLEQDWLELDGRWYYFSPKASGTWKEGEMVKGKQTINDKVYYFAEKTEGEVKEGEMIS